VVAVLVTAVLLVVYAFFFAVAHNFPYPCLHIGEPLFCIFFFVAHLL
jgi:hypothetical protein